MKKMKNFTLPLAMKKSFQDKVIYSRLLGVKISGTGGCPFKKIYN